MRFWYEKARDTGETREAIILSQGSGKRGVVDVSTVEKIASALKAIRVEHPRIRAIKARGDFPVDRIIVERSSTPCPTSARGQCLDDLLAVYGGANTDMSVLGFDGLLFPTPLDIPAVVRILGKARDVQSVSPDFYMGDGDDIFLIRKGNELNFVFKEGRGDCPSGCVQRLFFYFTYRPDTGEILKRTKTSDGIANLWGVPARFSLRKIQSFDHLRFRTEDPTWWVALHAVVVLGYLLEGQEYPAVGEDFEPPGHYQALRDAVAARRTDSVAALQEAVEYPDEDVRSAARSALKQAATRDARRNSSAIEESYTRPGRR